MEKYTIETSSKENTVRVKFTAPLDPLEWNNLRLQMVRMLKQGFLKWLFVLDNLAVATSVDIGMWVSCNGTVSSYSGTLQFSVRPNSTVHKTLMFTKLDRIFSIILNTDGTAAV